jgi:hypothetical protein
MCMTFRTDRTQRRGPATLIHAAGALAATLTLATLGIAATAGASVPGPRIEKPLTGVHVSPVPDVASSSAYLAGYQDTPTGGLASASVTFTVPKYTCTPAEEADGAFEANGVYTDDQQTLALVGAQCESGGAAYEYFFKVGSSDSAQLGAAPGDVIVASLFQSGSATFAKIHDLTNTDSWVADESANLGDTVVDMGTFRNPSLPVASYKKVAFTNAAVNGDDLGFESPTQVNVLNGGDLLEKTGGISTTATGSAFSVKFKKSS